MVYFVTIEENSVIEWNVIADSAEEAESIARSYWENGKYFDIECKSHHNITVEPIPPEEFDISVDFYNT